MQDNAQFSIAAQNFNEAMEAQKQERAARPLPVVQRARQSGKMTELEAKSILQAISRKRTALAVYTGQDDSPHARANKAATAKRRAKNRQARKSRKANRG